MKDLITKALDAARAASGPEEHDAVWRILETAAREPASAEVAIGLIGSSDPVVRAVGCDLLCCACDLHESVRADAASALLGLAPTETDIDVHCSLARALGRTADERAVPALCDLAGHADADVRYQVAQSLPAVATGVFDGAEIGALIRLSGDSDVGVRNWATFGLGSQCDVDTPAVRQALWTRVHADRRDVHEEAVFGLAKRRVPRATGLLIELLEAEDGIASWGLHAAACLRDAALLPYLGAYDDTEPAVATALRECDPDARAERDVFARALVDVLHRRIPTADWVLYSSRFDPDVTLETRLDGRAAVWSVDALIESSEGDIERAARSVRTAVQGDEP